MKLLDPRTGAFFRYFFTAYRWRSALMIGLLSIGGLLEGISVVALIPLLDIATAADDAGQSGVGRAVEQTLHSVGLEPTLTTLLGLIVLTILFKAVFLWLGMRQVGYTVARVTLDLRLQLVRALLRARWRHFGSQPLGRFAASISSEALRASAAYREACVVIAGLFQVAVYLVVSAMISWQITLLGAAAGGLLAMALRGFVAMSRAAGNDQTRLTQSLTSRLVDALQGIKPMKAMAREDLFWPLLEGEAQGLNQAHRRQIMASETRRLIQEPIATIILAVGLAVLLTLTERSFSTIMVLAFIFYRLMSHINTIQMRFQVMSVGESAFWSLREQIEAAETEEEIHAGTRRATGLHEAIELRGVSFAYTLDAKVLDDVSFRIPGGRFVALIGPSGSGKTTILDLITGLRRPSSGDVYVDGHPLEALDLKAWRNLIGYVPQEVFLFHDTIRNNVTLGDERFTDDEVGRALEAAGAWSFVSTRPEGIDTVVAPQGSDLSGGQRQRLAIARALVKQPALLVLDEATTGLDARTEAAICETLQGLGQDVTILAISHQTAIQNAADTVIRLEHGKVLDAETGAAMPASWS